MTPTIRQVVLEAEVGADPVAGRVLDEQGKSVAFSGWLELAAALEIVLGERQPSSPERE